MKTILSVILLLNATLVAGQLIVKEPRFTVSFKSEVLMAIYHPSGNLIAVSTNDGRVRLLEADGRQIKILTTHDGEVSHKIDFTYDSSQLIIQSGNISKVVDLDGNIIVEKSRDYSRLFNTINGLRVLSWPKNWMSQQSYLLSRTTGEMSGYLRDNYMPRPRFVHSSPDGNLILMNNYGNESTLWDVNSHKIKALFWGTNIERILAIPSNSFRYILTSGWDKKVCLWDASGHIIKVFPNHLAMSACFSSDDKYIVTSNNKKAVVWNLNGEPLAEFRHHDAEITSVNFSPDGSRLITSSKDHSMKIWDVPSMLVEENDEPVVYPSKTKDYQKETQIQNDYIRFTKVDIAIPKINKINKNRFALIIGNENYPTVLPKGKQAEKAAVYAINDATIFKHYCTSMLGIPESNIVFKTDESLSDFNSSVQELVDKMQLANNPEIIFYYAGHGIYDPKTKNQLLIPIGVNSSMTESCKPIHKIIEALNSVKPNRLLVLLDACYSGAQRGSEELLVALTASRSPRFKPDSFSFAGNTVVMASSTGDERSYANEAQKHGYFTYELLKLLKENAKKPLPLMELASLLKEGVYSKVLTDKQVKQTPTIQASPELGTTWQNWLWW